jgi:hypothetical protein
VTIVSGAGVEVDGAGSEVRTGVAGVGVAIGTKVGGVGGEPLHPHSDSKTIPRTIKDRMPEGRTPIGLFFDIIIQVQINFSSKMGGERSTPALSIVILVSEDNLIPGRPYCLEWTPEFGSTIKLSLTGSIL